MDLIETWDKVPPWPLVAVGLVKGLLGGKSDETAGKGDKKSIGKNVMTRDTLNRARGLKR